MQARGIAVVGVVANNGIWALEKHPMEAIYGYSVVADLRPETRYDKLAGGAWVSWWACARAGWAAAGV